MISEQDFNKLIELCTNDGKLDYALLSSITGMQSGHGMPGISELVAIINDLLLN